MTLKLISNPPGFRVFVIGSKSEQKPQFTSGIIYKTVHKSGDIQVRDTSYQIRRSSGQPKIDALKNGAGNTHSQFCMFDPDSTDNLHISIFAQKATDAEAETESDVFYNLFTFVHNVLPHNIAFPWRCTPDSRSRLIHVTGCFPMAEGIRRLQEITENARTIVPVKSTSQQSVEQDLVTQTKEYTIQFSVTQYRKPVFLPYVPKNSVANDWWPASLNNGFWLEQWFNTEAEIQLSKRTKKRIQESLGLNIDKLSDLLGTVTCANSWLKYHPKVSYNPDFNLLAFSLEGEVDAVSHHVTLHAWETEETLHRETIELPAGDDFVNIPLPFEPMRVGLDLYRDKKLIASRQMYVIMNVHVNLGLITGRVVIQRPQGSEERNIVTYPDRPTPQLRLTPWREAEQLRDRINRATQLKQTGSIFLRPGSQTQKQLMEFIRLEIIEPEITGIDIWDAYLDASVLPDLLEKALTIPSLSIRLMLSETGTNENPRSGTDLAQIVQSYQRCWGIREYLEHLHGAPVENVQIRNWYRKNGRQVFHDRFILTTQSVWHLGSSLKDLGDFHTTLYRVPDEMADEIRTEFNQAWTNGKFGEIQAVGFSMAPELKWLTQ